MAHAGAGIGSMPQPDGVKAGPAAGDGARTRLKLKTAARWAGRAMLAGVLFASLGPAFAQGAPPAPAGIRP